MRLVPRASNPPVSETCPRDAENMRGRRSGQKRPAGHDAAMRALHGWLALACLDTMGVIALSIRERHALPAAEGLVKARGVMQLRAFRQILFGNHPAKEKDV